MAKTDSLIQRGQLSGNVDQQILTYPTIRARVRRNDPDISKAYPYYPSLNTKTLIVDLKTSPTAVPTTITITFASDSYTDTIVKINTDAAGDIKAYDDNGYLTLQSLHGGGKNIMEITGGTALSILGFDVASLGGASRAGDIASAPAGGVVQSNPSGTVLISRDESLQSSVINRAILGSLYGIDQILSDLDREIPVFRTVSLVLAAPAASFNLSSSLSARLAIQAMDNEFGLDQIQIFDSTNQSVYVNDNRVRVSSVTYGALVNAAVSFVTWGTPDGKAVTKPAPTNTGLKVALTTITSIVGNIITATGANFITKRAQVKDIVTIQGATNSIPFDHNGQFVIVSVISEDSIAVRAMGTHEDLSAEDKPRALNSYLGGGGYGSVGVYLGNYLPVEMKSGAGNDRMFFNLNQTLPAGTYFITLPVGQTIREMGSNGAVVQASGLAPIHLKDPDLPSRGLTNSFKAINHFLTGLYLGESLLDASGSRTPRVIDYTAPTGTSIYTLLEEDRTVAGGNVIARTYGVVDTDGVHLALTFNCSWNGTVWVKDKTGIGASFIRFRNTKVECLYRSSDTNWNDSGWTTPFSLLHSAGDLTVLTSITSALGTLKQVLLQKGVSDTDTNALLIAKDTDGSVRYVLDHYGYPTARLTVFDEIWAWRDAASASGVADATAFNGGLWEIKCSVAVSAQYAWSIADPLMSGSFTLFGTAVNNLKSWFQNKNAIFALPGASSRNNVVLTAQWEAKISASDLNRTWMVGFFDDNTDPLTSANVGCWFQTVNGANWFGKIVGATAIDTTVAPDWGNYQRFRVEINGSATPVGVAAGNVVVTNFYINDALVATRNGTVNASSFYGKFGLYSANTGTPANTSLTIGPVKIVVNRYDSLPSL